MTLGIVPDSRLDDRSKVASNVRELTTIGIVLFKPLELRFKNWSLPKAPIVVGTVPLILFEAITKDVTHWKLPIEDGKVPNKLSRLMSIDIMLI